MVVMEGPPYNLGTFIPFCIYMPNTLSDTESPLLSVCITIEVLTVTIMGQMGDTAKNPFQSACACIMMMMIYIPCTLYYFSD